MKKILLYILFIVTAGQASAQKDVQAKAILNQVSQKYRSYNIIKSDFTFTVNNKQAAIQQTQNGTLITQSKTNKFKILLYTPATKADVEQEIISNGKSQWTYLKRDKEVQVSDAGSSGESFNPAQLFTMYDRGYKYLYTGDKKIDGKLYQLVELTPEDDQKPFFKVKLTIDKVKKQIYNALIFDKNGSQYNYTLRSFTTNAQIPESTFSFDAKTHPGVEVVDLR